MGPPGAARALVRADDVPLFTRPSILRTNPAHLPALGGPACFATSIGARPIGATLETRCPDVEGIDVETREPRRRPMNGGLPAARELRDGSARSSGAELLYRNVLDNVASGVMSLDSGGVITSFNAAASEIVGLTSEAVVGRTFAEVFSELEGADAFADVVLDAVYDSLVGHQRVVEATFAGRTRSLSMATSYLKEERDGETFRIGVVAIFNDISEIKELREKELRLVKEVQGKHAELRNAYVALEERNRELSTTSKRTNALRVGAAVVVLALFLGVGLYLWDAGPGTEGIATGAAQAAQGSFATLVVEPRRMSSTITVVGQLAPRREIEVTSPIKGTVAAVHFQYGERVAEGQRLVDLDVTGSGSSIARRRSRTSRRAIGSTSSRTGPITSTCPAPGGS